MASRGSLGRSAARGNRRQRGAGRRCLCVCGGSDNTGGSGGSRWPRRRGWMGYRTRLLLGAPLLAPGAQLLAGTHGGFCHRLRGGDGRGDTRAAVLLLLVLLARAAGLELNDNRFKNPSQAAAEAMRKERGEIVYFRTFLSGPTGKVGEPLGLVCCLLSLLAQQGSGR